MLRILCVENDTNAAAHVGGPVSVTHKTFAAGCPALEAWLKGEGNSYIIRSIVGVEIVVPITEPRVPDGKD